MNSTRASATPSPPGATQLAIDTIGRSASVAVLGRTHVLFQQYLPASPRAAATLAPTIKALLAVSRDQGHELRLISVADGPGSFTGLRIGVTTAKTLGYALGLPVVGVDSLAAIAAAVMYEHHECRSLLVGLNAYRGQTYVGQFSRSNLLPPIDRIPASWTPHPDGVRVVDAGSWRRCWQQCRSQTQFAGDAKAIDTKLQRLPARCTAIGVGLLAYRAAIEGQLIDPIQLMPRYLKPSAAEERLRSP